LKEYVAGEKLVLERNPYYWKKDAKETGCPIWTSWFFCLCPMLTRKFCGSNPGETDLLSRLSAENFSVLGRQQRGFHDVRCRPRSRIQFPVLNLNEPGKRPRRISRGK